MGRREPKVTWLQAELAFIRKGMWAEVLMSVLDHAAGEPLPLEEHAAAHLSGGLENRGYQCGMLWGAALAAGAQAYRRWGEGPRAEARTVLAVVELLKTFRGLAGPVDCREIIGLDMTGVKVVPLLKMLAAGKPLGCFFRAGRFAPLAYEVIDRAFAGVETEAVSLPVSCSAELARRMGASAFHATAAAGLAGGIGLGGGACGALGTAIWLTVMDGRREGCGNRALRARVNAVFTRFRSVAGEDFRCSAVTGRTFDTVDGHAAYLRSGGCSMIIEALAGSGT